MNGSSMHSVQPLAVVSMACRLPGGRNTEEFWRLVRSGDSAITELPHSVLDPDLHYSPEPGAIGKSYSRIAGLIDPKPPQIPTSLLSAEKAASLDMTHVQLLEVALEAIQRAGWNAESLPTREVGVFVGHTRGTARSGELVCRDVIGETAEYLYDLPQFQELAKGEAQQVVQQMVHATQNRYAPVTDDELKGSLEAHHAARLIHSTLGLQGPYMSMNAACASSLYALATGAMALWAGDIKMAIVGSASHCKVESLILFSKAGSVSATGSRPFDADADGFVSAEGYVVVMLKTLQQALADGDRIEAVIRGIGFASDGKGKSLWAPRHEGQVEAIRRAYGSHLRVDRVQYLEAHATSTPVGDSTEMQALARGVGDQLRPGQRVSVGSVKANIGHTLETAGLAGLVKSILAMQAKVIPPVANVKVRSAKIDWDNLPFDLPSQPQTWNANQDGSPRRAGVNAFGIGGLNAHVVVDEFVPSYADRYFESETDVPLPRPVAAIRPPSTAAHREQGTVAVHRQPEQEPLAIVGLGAILPGAFSWDEFWQQTLQGQIAPLPIPAGRFRTDLLTGVATTPLGFFVRDYQYDWKKHKVPPKQLQQADPLQFMLLDAVDQALRSGGFHERTFDRKRTGVIVGSIFGGEFGAQLQLGFRLQEFFADLHQQLVPRGASRQQIEALCDAYTDLFLKRMPALIDETGSFTSSTLASRCTKTFDLMGGATAIDCGTASGIAGVQLASWMLRTGQTDMMIVGSGHRSAGFKAYQDMIRRGRLAIDGSVQPLSDSGKSLPAEGVGVLVLKRLSSAQADGDTIHSVLRSVTSFTGTDARNGATQAVTNAIRIAGVAQDSVSLLEMAVDGTRDGNPEFCWGATTALESTAPQAVPLHLRTVSDSVGSLGGATSMVAMLRAAESVRQQEIAPLRAAADDIQTTGQRAIDFSQTARPLPIHADDSSSDTVAVGMVDGKQVYAAVFSPLSSVLRATTPRSAVTAATTETPVRLSQQADGDYRLTVVGADTVSELLAQLEAVGREPARYLQSLDEVQSPRSRHRVAIIARDAEELAAKIQPAWHGLQLDRHAEHLAVQGIFIGQCDLVNRVAFCFPGQGAQYAQMLQGWLAADVQARAAVGRVDQTLKSLGLPSYRQLTVDEGDQLGIDVFRTQLSVLLADALLLDRLDRWGVRPDAVVGHSFGEFAAMLAAGSWDLATAIRATQARCDAIAAASVPPSQMTSLLASAEVAQHWVDRIGGDLWVANQNAPEQTVVGGRVERLDQLETELQRAKVKFKRLNVPSAFHTPLMAAAQPPFASGLAGLRIASPRLPLLSTVTGDYVPDGERLRSGLVHQLVAPVRYQDSIQRLLAEGVRCFIEVGPSQALSGLNRRIAAGHSGVIAVPADQPGQPWSKSFATLRAVIAVQGLDQARPAVSPTTDPTLVVHSSPDPLVPILEVSGTAHQMGQQYGEANRRAIGEILEVAAGTFGKHRKPLPDLSEVLADRNEFWSAEDWEELCGVAEGAGVAVENMAALNYWLYPDIDAGCAHFVVPSADSKSSFWHGANEDLPLGTILGGPFPHPVVLRRPQGAIAYAHSAMIGQIGTITGMNESGLSISSSMLLDRPVHRQSARGRLHGLLVASVLRRASSIEAALQVLQSVRRRGAWCLLMADSDTEQQLYIEYDGDLLQTRVVEKSLELATNHSQLLSAITVPVQHSTHRLQRLESLFNNSDTRCSLLQTQNTLRDRFCVRQRRVVAHPTMETLRRVDNQASVILSPQQGKLWVAVSQPIHPMTVDHSLEEKGGDQRPDDRFVEVDLGKYGWQRQTLRINEKTPRESTVPQPSPLAAADEREPHWLSVQEYAALAERPPTPGTNADSANHCSRFVDRMVCWPDDDVDHAPPLPIEGDVWVVGDGALATAILQRLQTFGVSARQCSLQASHKQGAAWLSSLGPVAKHLILTVDHHHPIDIGQASYQQARGLVDSTYQVCQHWYRALTERGGFAGASCVAATVSDGSFGATGRLGSIASGAVVGLVRAIRMESHVLDGGGLHAQTIDLHYQIAPERAAELVVGNLAARRAEREVGYDAQGRRGLLSLVALPAMPTPTTAAAQNRSTAGAWIVTGGARGVTAAAVEAVAKQFAGPFHLIGASPLPEVDPQWLRMDDSEIKTLRASVMRQAAADKQSPADCWSRMEKAIEIAGNLQRLRDQGVDCHYWSCDVSDRTALGNLVNQIRQSEHKIIGVIHGAGFEKATKFASKKWPFVQRTVDAKVDGCAALMQITENDPLQYFATFGSISGRFGGVGQTDYCLANGMQAKLASWYQTQRPDVRVVNIAWHAWDEVGMAARPETRNSPLLAKFHFMSVREGVGHLIADLGTADREAEVTITPWDHHKRYQPVVPKEWLVAEPVRHQPSWTFQSLARADRRPLTGSVAILGQNPDVDQLASDLRKRGLSVTLIAGRERESAVKQFSSLLTAALPDHLIIASNRNTDAWNYVGEAAWQQRLQETLQIPAEIMALWFAAAAQQNRPLTSLSALLCLDGSMATQRSPLAPLGAALAALLLRHSPNQERPSVAGQPLVKVIDAGTDLPAAALATAWMDEMECGDHQQEIAILATGRHVLTWNQQPLGTVHDQANRSGQTWLALCSKGPASSQLIAELGKRLDCKLHTICVEDFVAASDDSSVSACVSHRWHPQDRAALRSILDRIRQTDGDIHGVIDLTCIANADSSELATAATDIAQLLSWKRDLIDETRRDPIRDWVQLGHDRAGRLIAAAALLASEISSPAVRVLELAAPALDPLAGTPEWIDSWAEIAVNEIHAGQRRSQVRWDSMAVPSKAAKRSPTSTAPLASPTEVRQTYQLNGDEVYLREHRFRDTPLMPLVVSIELLVRAAADLQPLVPPYPLQMRDISILNSLPVPPGPRQQIEVVSRATAGGVEACLRSDLTTRGGKHIEGGRTHVKLRIQQPAEELHDLPPPEFPETGIEWFRDLYSSNEAIYHGAPFRMLQCASFQKNGMWGVLEMPAETDLLDNLASGSIWTPAAVLDSALFLAGLSVWREDQRSISLPVGLDRLTIYRVPSQGETLIAWASLARQQGPHALVDFSIWDSAGHPVLVAQDYRCAVLRERTT